MILYPAIDLINGQCVRLYKGDFNQKTTYDVSPFEVLETYKSEGAQWVHIVDLDGAKDSHNRQSDLMKKICDTSGLKIQTGGGIRSMDDVDDLIDLGVSRVVIGSMAVSKADETKEILKKYGAEKICIAMDVFPEGDDFKIAVSGWQEGSSVSLDAHIKSYQEYGLKHVLCTDIAKDGTMQGCNKQLYKKLRVAYPEIDFQASGGVHSLSDIEDVEAAGVIVGKALYENVFSVADALKTIEGRQ